jgi:hypothetical protein
MSSLQMNKNSKAAFGIFRSNCEVKNAKLKLKAQGFSSRNISVLYPSDVGSRDFPQRQKSLIVKGTLWGAVAGGLIFILISALLRWDPFPIEEISSSLGFSVHGLVTTVCILIGTLIGAACGALVGIGTPERASQRYGDYVSAGGILVSVNVDGFSQEREAQTTLDRSGAQDISLLNEGRAWESVYSKMSHLN